MKKTISRLKMLENENEKLREALVDALLPLHTVSKYYGRPSLKSEVIDLAKKALNKAKAALEYDNLDMAFMTETELEDWDEDEFPELDAFLGTKDDEYDDD